MDSFNLAFTAGSFALTWNALMLVLGILTAFVVSEIIVRRRGGYKDLALDACIIGIPAGLIGGRLFSAISGKIAFSAFFNLAHSGLNLPGALLFAGIGIAVYARVKKLSVAEVFDILAPGAFFGLAVGRWSDFFLCDGLGPIVGGNVPKFFPLATFTRQYFQDHMTVAYAVFFLDFLICLALGVAALLLKKRERGTASRATILVYLFCEFVLEWLRDGSTRQIVFGEVRFNQIILIAMLLFFVGLILYRTKHAAQPGETPLTAAEGVEAEPAEETLEEPAETAEEPAETAEEPEETAEEPAETAEEPSDVSAPEEGDPA